MMLTTEQILALWGEKGVEITDAHTMNTLNSPVIPLVGGVSEQVAPLWEHITNYMVKIRIDKLRRKRLYINRYPNRYR